MTRCARAALLVVVSAALATAAVAQEKPGKKDAVMPATSLTWQDGPVNGVKVAALWGDMTNGAPYGVLIRFEPGLMHPLHYHTESLRIVVLSGTFVHRPEGGTETRLGPGSYVMQAGGQRHVSGCALGAECQFFMTSGAAFDLIPVERPSAEIKANGQDGPITIPSGQSVTLSWNSTGFTACSVCPGGLIGTHNTGVTVGPLGSKHTYTLICHGPNATTGSDLVIVNVAAAPAPR